ncbi:hypothetical protein [Mycobacteroides abscessus]|uniref:hypothetical protein n=1 Tax=Mycobacteroides abscessus TaxID=36809 RepID=UPI0012FFDC5B|nr:hypothetical protein [Mycobacteroides abscessus]
MNWLAFALVISTVATGLSWRAFCGSYLPRAEHSYFAITIALVASDATLVGLLAA